MYNIGDLYKVQNDITGIMEDCTIVFIDSEEISELGVLFIHLKSEDETKNDKSDPRCENYYKIVTVNI